MNEKLDVAGVLERVFGFYRARVTVLLSAAAIVFLLVAVLNAVLLSASSGLLGFLLANAALLIGTFFYQGVVVETVAESQDYGGAPRVGDLFRSVAPRLQALVVGGLLAGLAVAIGLALVVIPGVILFTLWWVLIPVIVLEELPVMKAFRRSRELVRGNFIRVLGVVAAVLLIQYVVTLLLEQIGGGFAGYLIGSLVALIVTAPIGALAATITYFDLLRISGAADRPLTAVEPDSGWESQPAAEQPVAAESAIEAVGSYPADWYPDPHQHARLRYWDGARWTEHTAD